MSMAADRLNDLDDVSRVRIQPAVGDQHLLVFATVTHAAAEQVRDGLRALGVPAGT